MEYLPNLRTEVKYPKGRRIDRTTLFNLRLFRLDTLLMEKVANEFKHCIRNHNPYNFIDDKLTTRYTGHLDDYNNYDCFQRS